MRLQFTCLVSDSESVLYWGGSGARKGMYGVRRHLVTLGMVAHRLTPTALYISAYYYFTMNFPGMQGVYPLPS